MIFFAHKIRFWRLYILEGGKISGRIKILLKHLFLIATRAIIELRYVSDCKLLIKYATFLQYAWF